MYEYIFIDLDDTLFDFKKSEVSAFKAVADYVGYPYSSELFDDYAQYNQKLWQQLENGLISKNQLISTRFPKYFEKYGISSIPNDVDEHFRHHLALAADLIDGAKHLLNTLKENNKQLFAASNGVYHTQLFRLERTELMNYFDKLFISEKIGYSKPHPLFFETSFKQIPNFNLKKAIMIGDSLTSDIKGANNIGMDVIWFSPEKQHKPDNLSIDYQVQTLHQILQILI